MNLRMVTAPTVEPVTLAQAKVHLRIAADDDPVDSPPAVGPDDSRIADLIVVAREHAEQYTGRCFTDATYELRFGAFEGPAWVTHHHTSIWASDWINPWFYGRADTCPLRLPMAPVQSIESVTYVDKDGTTQTLDPSIYVLDDDPDQPSIRLAYGQQWPAIRYEPNAVRVRFQGGYDQPGSDPAPNPVPRVAAQAMLLMIGEWYENRENSIIERGTQFELPYGARALLTPLRRIMGV